MTIFDSLSLRELEVLNLIHKKGPITKKDIQALTDIKLTTLNRIMNSLQDNKVIIEYGESESTGGRKAIEYVTVPTGFYIIGIDISRSYVKVVLTNLQIDVLGKEEFSMDNSYSPEKTVEKVVYIIERMLTDLKVKKREVLGIGIGTVGPLDRDRGVILNPKNFFNGSWSNIPLKSMIQEKLCIPCFLDNGANTAVLAEYLFGRGQSLKNVVYIHCGIGLRSSIIADGIIIRSMNDREDAFGHMIVNYDAELTDAQSRGCIEDYSTIDSIVKKINLRWDDSTLKNEINYKELANSQFVNSEYAANVINNAAGILGIGLTNLVRLLNPELIILSGPLIMNLPNYYERCIEVFNTVNSIDNKIKFCKGGRFGEDAIAIGAAAMVVEMFLKRI